VLQNIHGDVGFVAEQMDLLNAVGDEVRDGVGDGDGVGVGVGVGVGEGVGESENMEGMEGTLE
jgi:hypothetical protein